MNMLDYVLLAILLISCIMGLLRGLITEAVSLLTWIVGLYLAFHFSGPLSAYLTYFHDMMVRYIISFIILLALILIVGHLIEKLLNLTIKKIGLGFLNRLLGLIFGFVRAALLIVVALALSKTFAPLPKTLTQNSVLLPHLQWAVNAVSPYLPHRPSFKLDAYTQINPTPVGPSAPVPAKKS
jgi:membrane protein required for colicin V production